MRLALAQIDTTVGDLPGNREKILACLEEAKQAHADLVLFPELAVTGYPPEDLLLRPGFLKAAESSLAEIARSARGIAALVGFPRLERDLYNACAVCAGGEVKAVYRKRFLPNYGVFDEHRYFAPGRDLVLLELGLRDYVDKNGFREIVVAVSGGIDSAVTAALAAEALGPDRVHCVSMPSRYSSDETRADARRLAESLGTPFLELPIESIVEAATETLSPVFEGLEPDIAEENLQARIRGVLLMALSNKFGWLVVATGNKSELSV